MLEIVYRESGKLFTVSASDDNLQIRESALGDRHSVYLAPKRPVTLESAVFKIPFDFKPEDRLFLNGYQSWTFCCEQGTYGRERSLRHCPKPLVRLFDLDMYGDRHFYPERYKKGLMHGYSYAYVRRGEQYILFASLCESTGFTRFVFDCTNGIVSAEKDCSGRELQAEYTALDFVVLEGTEDEVFDRWFSLLGATPLTTKKLSGYTSWYNYYQNISEKVILNDLSGLLWLPVTPDIFQIDDGFETYVGDWLSVDKEKFPRGLAPIADEIRRAGCKPGIWLAPFVAEKNSALVREHPEWLLRKNGRLVRAGSNWSGVYVLDFYYDDVKRYIKKCIRTAIDEWGFELLKLDFLYAVCIMPRRDKTRGEIMDEAMSFLREACGDAAILGCGVPLAPAFGRVDYCRIGADVSLEWDGPWYMRLFHGERPSTKNTMRNSVYRRQLSGRAFMNDPDVFILRSYNVSMTDEQKFALGTVNGLFGGLLFASDNFSRYTDCAREAYMYFSRLKDADIISVETVGQTVQIKYFLDGEEKLLRFN